MGYCKLSPEFCGTEGNSEAVFKPIRPSYDQLPVNFRFRSCRSKPTLQSCSACLKTLAHQFSCCLVDLRRSSSICHFPEVLAAITSGWRPKSEIDEFSHARLTKSFRMRPLPASGLHLAGSCSSGHFSYRPVIFGRARARPD